MTCPGHTQKCSGISPGQSLPQRQSGQGSIQPGPCPRDIEVSQGPGSSVSSSTPTQALWPLGFPLCTRAEVLYAHVSTGKWQGAAGITSATKPVPFPELNMSRSVWPLWTCTDSAQENIWPGRPWLRCLFHYQID